MVGENSIALVIKSSIIIRNLAAFYNYNFEIGIRVRRTAKGGRRKAKGQREKVKKLKQPNKPNEPNKPQQTTHKIQLYLTI
jgi:hypothetical protein